MRPSEVSWGLCKTLRASAGGSMKPLVHWWGLTKPLSTSAGFHNPLGAFGFPNLLPTYKQKYWFRHKIVYHDKSEYLWYYVCISPDI